MGPVKSNKSSIASHWLVLLIRARSREKWDVDACRNSIDWGEYESCQTSETNTTDDYKYNGLLLTLTDTHKINETTQST